MATKSLSERLVGQLMRMQEREAEYESAAERLVAKSNQEAELQKQLETLQERLSKVDKVRSSLEKLNDESDAKYTEAQQDDAVQRKSMAEELKVEIAAANEETQRVGERERQAEQRNGVLKKQLEIYDENTKSGTEKFETLVSTRSDEMDKMQSKQASNTERIPLLNKLIEEETKKLKTAKEEQEAIRGEVDVFLSRFATIQKQLDAAKESYEAAKVNNDRNVRAVKALESDTEMMLRRAHKSKQERDKELAKVKALEEKAETIRSQVMKYESIRQMLSSSAGGETPS